MTWTLKRTSGRTSAASVPSAAATSTVSIPAATLTMTWLTRGSSERAKASISRSSCDLAGAVETVDRIDGPVERTTAADRERLPDAVRSGLRDGTRGAGGFEQLRQHDFVGIRETRLLAGQRARRRPARSSDCPP